MEKISCPNCDHKFDIEGALAKEMQEQYAQKVKQETHRLNEKFAAQEAQLQEQIKSFEEKKKKENELFKQKLDKALEEKEVTIKEKLKEDFNTKIQSQEKELVEYAEKVKVLRGKEIELVKMQRKIEEVEKEMELRMQQKLLDEQQKIEETISKRIHEQTEMKIREKDKQLEDQKKLIDEMKRKAEQGSMQMQGEVQEMAIEEYLQRQFPRDKIIEIKKGARGADCMQQVQNELGEICGLIYYESKRTKDFSPAWIEKFKNDMRQKGADIGVLVTEALPKGVKRMTEINKIWVCQFADFKILSQILRNSLLQLSQVKESQQNKGEKMEVLYDFLTSNEFKMQIEAIVEGFSQMQTDLNKEKNAFNKIWAQREKQINKVILNTSNMYGSIRGIAGKAIPTVEQLELPGIDED